MLVPTIHIFSLLFLLEFDALFRRIIQLEVNMVQIVG